ncbi:hypothetical protein ABK040_005467 [Willaertia magna]
MSIKWRRVTTSFIEWINDGNSFIFLFQRSGKVGSFPHHWASISGSMEYQKDFKDNKEDRQISYLIDKSEFTENAYQCAIRELEEETQLKVNKDLTFIRSGRPLWVKIPEKQRGFLVYPFLFRLKEKRTESNNEECSIEKVKEKLMKRLQIDWEHENFNLFETETFLYQDKKSNVKKNEIVYFTNYKGEVEELLGSGLTMEENIIPTLDNTVPQLNETLHRVYFSSKHLDEDKLEKCIKEYVQNNKIDGAAKIAQLAIEQVLLPALYLYKEKVFNQNDKIPPYFPVTLQKELNVSDEMIKRLFFMNKLKDLIWHLDNARREMAPIGNLAVKTLVEAFSMTETNSPDILTNNVNDSEKWFNEIEERIHNVLNEYKQTTERISYQFVDRVEKLRKKINGNNSNASFGLLTHSCSSTILFVLKQLINHFLNQKQTLHLFITESRPEKEGYRTLSILSDFLEEKQKEGFNTETIQLRVCTESTVGYLASSKKINGIVVGADAIEVRQDKSLQLYNKNGTSTLHAVAAVYKIPFFVLCDSYKFREEEESESEREHLVASSSSLFAQPSFDNTPFDDRIELITEIQTEQSTSRLIEQVVHNQRIFREKLYGSP